MNTNMTIERQRKYVEAQKAQGDGMGIVFADAFLRGMRDIGYKSPAWAAAEIIDNAVQAAATKVSVRLGYGRKNTSRKKHDAIAICDNGNGMIQEMISYAVRWGGTDREDDRHGFGRYGYGLPSAAVSMAKRYTVYSKHAGAGWHAVTVDIEALAAVAGSLAETARLLQAESSEPPTWVLEGHTDGADDDLDLPTLESGTVVVLEDLDRLRRLTGWVTSKSFREKMRSELGVIYRHWMPERKFYIDGLKLEPTDPLFQMEHARGYDDSAVRAEVIERRTFEVQSSRGKPGRVTIRASVLPPNFQLTDPDQYGVKGAKLNQTRWGPMRRYNGLLICRQGRQIDCISPGWTKFQNYDANIKIEVDFEPEIDEFFGITTAKQQITIEEDFHEKLLNPGARCGNLRALVADMRSRFFELKDSLKAQAENTADAERPPASTVAMDVSAKFKDRTPEPTAEQQEEADTNVEREARERSKSTGETKEEAKRKVREATSENRWDIKFEANPEGPFFRPMRLGQVKRVFINTDHPYYTRLYEAGSDEVRASLQVTLLVLAERELEAQGDAETFYKSERNKWSERLRHALEALEPDEAVTDKVSAAKERLYYEADRPSS